jgi:cyclopropane fatty-acyl-phospholipid synthase-like methyltransferase
VYFDYLYRTEPDPWSCFTSPYEQAKYRRTLDALPRQVVGRVLEIGCGEGLFTSAVAARAEEVLGLDISQAALSRARQRCSPMGHVKFRRVDVTRDPLPVDFDVLIAAEVLYYLGHGSQYRSTCGKLVSCLAQGGHLIVVNPSSDAKRLNGVFGEPSMGARLVQENVVHDSGRPYVISVFHKSQ